MITVYLELLAGFLRVGCFSFGGAYGAIPLIRDVVRSYGWMSDAMLTYMVAVSESTPGPIMVNLATYVGSQQGGLLGAVIATTAVVLPSFFVILLLTIALKSLDGNRYVQALMNGIKPGMAGVILATGAYMAVSDCLPAGGEADPRPLILTGILAAAMVIPRLAVGRKLPPVALIALSALCGAVVYSI